MSFNFNTHFKRENWKGWFGRDHLPRAHIWDEGAVQPKQKLLFSLYHKVCGHRFYTHLHSPQHQDHQVQWWYHGDVAHQQDEVEQLCVWWNLALNTKPFRHISLVQTSWRGSPTSGSLCINDNLSWTPEPELERHSRETVSWGFSETITLHRNCLCPLTDAPMRVSSKALY